MRYAGQQPGYGGGRGNGGGGDPYAAFRTFYPPHSDAQTGQPGADEEAEEDAEAAAEAEAEAEAFRQHYLESMRRRQREQQLLRQRRQRRGDRGAADDDDDDGQEDEKEEAEEDAGREGEEVEADDASGSGGSDRQGRGRRLRGRQAQRPGRGRQHASRSLSHESSLSDWSARRGRGGSHVHWRESHDPYNDEDEEAEAEAAASGRGAAMVEERSGDGPRYRRFARAEPPPTGSEGIWGDDDDDPIATLAATAASRLSSGGMDPANFAQQYAYAQGHPYAHAYPHPAFALSAVDAAEAAHRAVCREGRPALLSDGQVIRVRLTAAFLDAADAAEAQAHAQAQAGDALGRRSAVRNRKSTLELVNGAKTTKPDVVGSHRHVIVGLGLGLKNRAPGRHKPILMPQLYGSGDSFAGLAGSGSAGKRAAKATTRHVGGAMASGSNVALITAPSPSENSFDRDRDEAFNNLDSNGNFKSSSNNNSSGSGSGSISLSALAALYRDSMSTGAKVTPRIAASGPKLLPMADPSIEAGMDPETRQMHQYERVMVTMIISEEEEQKTILDHEAAQWSKRENEMAVAEAKATAAKDATELASLSLERDRLEKHASLRRRQVQWSIAQQQRSSRAELAAHYLATGRPQLATLAASAHAYILAHETGFPSPNAPADLSTLANDSAVMSSAAVAVLNETRAILARTGTPWGMHGPAIDALVRPEVQGPPPPPRTSLFTSTKRRRTKRISRAAEAEAALAAGWDPYPYGPIVDGFMDSGRGPMMADGMAGYPPYSAHPSYPPYPPYPPYPGMPAPGYPEDPYGGMPPQFGMEYGPPPPYGYPPPGSYPHPYHHPHPPPPHHMDAAMGAPYPPPYPYPYPYPYPPPPPPGAYPGPGPWEQPYYGGMPPGDGSYMGGSAGPGPYPYPDHGEYAAGPAYGGDLATVDARQYWQQMRDKAEDAAAAAAEALACIESKTLEAQAARLATAAADARARESAELATDQDHKSNDADKEDVPVADVDDAQDTAPPEKDPSGFVPFDFNAIQRRLLPGLRPMLARGERDLRAEFHAQRMILKKAVARYNLSPAAAKEIMQSIPPHAEDIYVLDQLFNYDAFQRGIRDAVDSALKTGWVLEEEANNILESHGLHLREAPADASQGSDAYDTTAAASSDASDASLSAEPGMPVEAGDMQDAGAHTNDTRGIAA
jgi:hypothetical protein